MGDRHDHHLKPLLGRTFFWVVLILSFNVSLQATEGLGPQLFLESEKPAVVLHPIQGGLGTMPRQKLWRQGREDWVTYKGWLSSTFEGPENLLLIYRKTIFAIGEDLKLQLVRKAPPGMFFLATSGPGEDAPMLVKRFGGEFDLLTSSGNVPTFSSLAPYLKREVIPWSSPQYPFLYFPRQKEQSEPIICIFDATFKDRRIFDLPVPGFSLVGIGEGDEGIWLQGEEGINLFFDGMKLQTASLPEGLMTKGLLSFDRDGEGWGALYGAEDGSLELARSGSQTIKLPGLRPDGQVDVQEEQGAHVQSVMMFAVMMVTLFMVLRWRQESEANLPGKVEQVTASLWLRCFAFIMDFFLLSIPVTSVAHLLGIEGTPMLDLAYVGSLSDDQLMEVLQQFVFLSAKMNGLLVILACVYHVSLERWLGGSFGKLFFRLKVVDREGKPPSIRASVIKAFWRSLDLAIFPLISFISAISHGDRWSLGDRFSGLQVVQTRRT